MVFLYPALWVSETAGLARQRIGSEHLWMIQLNLLLHLSQVLTHHATR